MENLEFIHITKTAGTSIEDCGLKIIYYGVIGKRIFMKNHTLFIL